MAGYKSIVARSRSPQPLNMELKCDEGTVYGARYYTAQPIQLDYLYGQSHTEWNNMIKWCVDTYGPSPSDGIWTPGARWYVNNAKFWFRKIEDRSWFMLRWQ
jgi:hypothetical protein